MRLQYISATIILALILICIGNDTLETSSETRFWAALHLLLHGGVFVFNLKQLRFRYSPFVLFIAILSFFTWGVSPYFVNTEDFQLGYLDDFTTQAAFYAYAVFYLVLNKVETWNYNRLMKAIKVDDLSKSMIVPLRHVEARSFTRLKYIFLGLYLITQFVLLPISGLNSIIIYYTCGLLLAGFFLKLNSLAQNILFIIILLYECYNTVSSGLIYPLIFLSVFLFVIILNFFTPSFRNNIFVSAFGITIVIFTILFSSVKTEYRKQNTGDLGLLERVELVQDLLSEEELVVEEEEDFLEKTQSGPIWRISYPVSALSLVIEKTPEEVSFWNGESYSPILYKFIPRAIWPDKPVEEMGQLFGHRYKILRETDLVTSMNTPILAEAYMNFSMAGLLTVSALLAFCIGTIFFRSNIKQDRRSSMLQNILNVLKLALITSFYIQWESNLSLMLGNVIILFVTDYLLRRFLLLR